MTATGTWTWIETSIWSSFWKKTVTQLSLTYILDVIPEHLLSLQSSVFGTVTYDFNNFERVTYKMVVFGWVTYKNDQF